MTKPVALGSSWLASFRKLAGWKDTQAAAGVPMMALMAHSFRLCMAVMTLPAFPVGVSMCVCVCGWVWVCRVHCGARHGPGHAACWAPGRPAQAAPSVCLPPSRPSPPGLSSRWASWAPWSTSGPATPCTAPCPPTSSSPSLASGSGERTRARFCEPGPSLHPLCWQRASGQCVRTHCPPAHAHTHAGTHTRAVLLVAPPAPRRQSWQAGPLGA